MTTASKTKAEVATAAAESDTKAEGKVEKLELSEANTQLEWTGSKVTGKHDGSFKKLAGSVELVDGKLENGKVAVTIDMSSVEADHPKLTGHLKSGDFFEIDKHPEAKFVSTKVEKGGKDGATHTITGNLTLRGVTKSIRFPATIKSENGKLMVNSEFVINRKDFGVDYPGKPDDLIRDNVVLRLKLNVPRKAS